MTIVIAEMTDAVAATCGFFGLIALFIGLFGKDFYPALVRTGKTRVPTWLGRLWFLGFAVLMFYLSTVHFLHRH